MSQSNFCANCGARLARRGWRAFARGTRCDDCASRLGKTVTKPLVIVTVIAVAAFAFGRYLRTAPPPLIIHRAANSPLADVPANFAIAKDPTKNANRVSTSNTIAAADEPVYICGARTKKGTPCRRRVHTAGERCYQHKGMPAMVSLDKLTIKPDVAKK